ncbi:MULTISPECIES: hypothetical protein [unclassified Crossiella]|uniref:hypothetical protein n=1 Tax=unclassified Crossiella TaxID=2620835 RepID=UPI001FFE6E06|nr:MULTISPECIES: hypothetical protein [unclassified Crossiella]MCK2241837.1 hypothetical protein [Crossiella sp. S99.2]MCK2255740.1 hypothetical protein [Crossiella sp. S99.1]
MLGTAGEPGRGQGQLPGNDRGLPRLVEGEVVDGASLDHGTEIAAVHLIVGVRAPAVHAIEFVRTAPAVGRC